MDKELKIGISKLGRARPEKNVLFLALHQDVWKKNSVNN
jgi:hypothetical protein